MRRLTAVILAAAVLLGPTTIAYHLLGALGL
jgi:hypothetical protein